MPPGGSRQALAHLGRVRLGLLLFCLLRTPSLGCAVEVAIRELEVIEIYIKMSWEKLREDFVLLKLAGRGSSSMSHLQLERTLGRAFLPSAEWSCHGARGQGREKNALIHFLTRYAWEDSLQGRRQGGCGFVFPVAQLHISSAVQLQTPTRRPELPRSPAPASTVVVIGLVLQRKWLLLQPACNLRKSTGWAPARFKLTKMFNVFGFRLTIFLKISLLSYH